MPKGQSLARWFFDLLGRALDCRDCKFHSPLLRERQWQIMQYAINGELLSKMQPGEILMRRQKEVGGKQFYDWVYFVDYGDGEILEIGCADDVRTTLLQAFEALRR